MSLKKKSQVPIILIGIIGLLSAWYLYNKLSAFELNKETDLSLPLVLVFIYGFFGKSVASGILALGGLIFIVSGILNINNQKKWDEVQIENSKPRFISFSKDLEFEVVRKLSDDLVHYFERSNFEIKEGQIYKHYWTDSLVFENIDDENFLNITTYFWEVNLPFWDTLLPNNFQNFQNFQFRFLNCTDNIRSEKIVDVVNRYYYQDENKKITISSLFERNIIEYCEIQNLDYDDSNDLKYYQDELYFMLTNPIIKCRNNELYVDENLVSIEIAYAIGAIELVRTKRNI